jgi:hypothetical protein
VYQIPLQAREILLANGDLGSYPFQLRRIFRVVVRAEKSGVEFLLCPSVMEQAELAQGSQYQDKQSSEGNIRRNVVSSEVTDNGVSCQNLLQAPQLAAKVGCLGIHRIALEGL